MQSSAYATGGVPVVPASQKAQNETYFASMGSANNSRSTALPPSKGGRYAGFGSDSSYNPSSATSSRALPSVEDIRQDPAAALGRGWGFMTAALGALNESVSARYLFFYLLGWSIDRRFQIRRSAYHRTSCRPDAPIPVLLVSFFRWRSNFHRLASRRRSSRIWSSVLRRRHSTRFGLRRRRSGGRSAREIDWTRSRRRLRSNRS